ncbi:hypothetical protein [Paenibacillus albiflavus]|uniref:hypothetical protein n=1 Tax=Paenibacillus albiflavus TaxID=2545760 RepID=UPI00104FD2FD|nr:hypothetical protein [Paenibacillus albiflavus]
MCNLKRYVLIAALAIVLFVGIGIYFLAKLYGFFDSPLSPIAQSDIPQVLHLSELPVIPNSLDIVTVEKYDDGFTSPFVKIQYKDGIALKMTSKSGTYKDMELENIQIDGHYIEWYRSNDKQVYSTKFNHINYSFEFAPNLNDQVIDYLKSLK